VLEGRRIRRSLKTSDRREAERVAAKIYADAVAGLVPGVLPLLGPLAEAAVVSAAANTKVERPATGWQKLGGFNGKIRLCSRFGRLRRIGAAGKKWHKP
jgi:hypothetical protein